MTVQAVITADNHLDPSAIGFGAARLKRKEDHLRCFEEVVEYARKNRPDLFLICGDLFDTIRPGNWIRARLMFHLRDLNAAGIRVFMVSGQHDTPKNPEDGTSPLAVYGNSGNAVYFGNPSSPDFYRFQVANHYVQVLGVGYNPFLSPGEDPLSKLSLSPPQGINILITHYPIEGFSGYFGEEPLIRLASIPKPFNLVAAGHLHRHQKFRAGGTSVVCPGSTERASFAEENEEKGFVWAEIEDDGETRLEFVKTHARPFKTLYVEFPEHGDPVDLLKRMVSEMADPELVLKVRLVGRLKPERLAAYRRSHLLTHAQPKFFHLIVEEEFEVEYPQPVTPPPRTTPLAELRRHFERLLADADEEERPILEEALRLSLAKLEEAGAW